MGWGKEPEKGKGYVLRPEQFNNLIIGLIIIPKGRREGGIKTKNTKNLQCNFSPLSDLYPAHPPSSDELFQATPSRHLLSDTENSLLRVSTAQQEAVHQFAANVILIPSPKLCAMLAIREEN